MSERATLKVKVIPNASVNVYVGLLDGQHKFKIKAPPEGGRANRELCVFIAKLLGVPKRAVVVVSGQTSRQKLLTVETLTEETLLARLNQR